MQYGGYGRKYKVKPRFYVFAAVIAGLLIWGLVALFGLFKPARIEWGRLSSNQPINAIVLRDEAIVKADELSKLTCIATEGQAVTKESAVAMLYLTGYSEKDIVNLDRIQKEIKDYQENNRLKDVRDNDLELLNSQIDAKMKEISDQVIRRETQNLAVTEHELRTLMSERKAYMFTSIMTDETLTRMYQQETALQEKINKTRKAVPAPADGLVSFYLDDYESLLTVASIEKMTPGTMKALMEDILENSKPYKSEETVRKDQPICRIANPAKWYAVIVMNAKENPLVAGTEHEVTFDGLQKTVNAKVLKVMTEGRDSIAVLEIPEGVKELLSLRLVNGFLGQDITGLRVPVNMIREENGRAWIAIQGSGANVTSVEVHVLGRDTKYAIIEAVGEVDIYQGLELAKP